MNRGVADRRLSVTLPACGLAAWALVCCTAANGAPSGADLAKQIRAATLDPAQCYHVRDLPLIKEDLKLYFNEGYLIFSKPVNGEIVSAVFTDEVEGGDGEVLLLPPYRGERKSLAQFAQTPNLDEHFRVAVLVFSDGSAQSLLDSIANGAGKKALEMGPLLDEKWSPVLANIESGFDLRVIGDLLTPLSERRGLMFATLAGKHVGNFDVFYDLRSQGQITAGRQNATNASYAYDVWTSFPSRSYRNGTAKPGEPPLGEEKFQIDASLDADLALRATVRDSIRVGKSALRTLTFVSANAMQIDSVRVDGQPAELLLSDSTGGGAVRDAQNAPFLVIPETELAPSSSHEVEFVEHGSVISPAGNDVYFVGARSNWYPRVTSGLAAYDLTFRYPKRLTLVTAGDIVEDRIDGEFRVTRRVTQVPIRLAGFNLGDYEKAEGTARGIRVEVYGNRNLEAALQPKPPAPVNVTPPQGPPRRVPRGALPQHAEVDSPTAPNPLARLQAVAADISSSLQYFSGLFGPPALNSLTVSPIPGAFGQGFPGLVYLSTLSYLKPEQRPEEARGPREQLFYSDLIEAHEVAHQWWGDVVIPEGYQDEWLAEALASYSSLMYLETKKGVKAMEDVLEDYRDLLLLKNSKGSTIESTGPITWGFRLQADGNDTAWRDITYYKGAWVLHMLRRRLGDDRFTKMLAELRRRYDSRTVSTAQFAALIKGFVPPAGSGAKVFNVDSFFDNWVYSTGIPAIKVTYSVKGAAPAVRISGTVAQSGVDDGFSAEVPVEIQFAKAAPQVIWVETSNDGANFSATLKQAPVKVSIQEGREVLAVKQ